MAELCLAALALTLAPGGCAPKKSNAGSAAKDEALAGFQRFTSEEGGYAVEMPAPTHEKRAREGPMTASIVHAVDIDGSRYEVARFDMPEPLDEASRAELLAKVARGLTGARGAREISRRSVTGKGDAAMELDVGFPGGEQGRWWIFFDGAQRLFQVSVLGPLGERYAAGAVRFFRSFKLRQGSVEFFLPDAR